MRYSKKNIAGFWSHILCGFLLLPGLALVPVNAEEQPNIIFIMTDDMRTDELPFMPNVDALLVSQGMQFPQAFVTTSLCCPSRVSILRGQFSHNHQVLNNRPPNGSYEVFHDLGHESSTIATWLQAAGYRTGLFGKYLNAYPLQEDQSHVPIGWDDWNAFTQGGRGYFRYKINQNGELVQYVDAEEDYSTDVLSALAVGFIQQYAVDSRPMFAYVSPSAPHSPSTPAPRHLNEFEGITFPQSPSFNEEDVSDKPAWIQALDTFGPATISGVDDLYRARLQTLLAVDEMVAAIVQALDDQGILDNTFIFFYSDNGQMMGEHRLLGKGVPYEEAIKVPLVVRGPGVTAGSESAEFALNIDLAPTFADIAGAVVPSFVDGRSFGPTLLDPRAGFDRLDRFLVELGVLSGGGPQAAQPFSGVRSRRHLYVEWDSGETELYDLRNDPYQLDNIYDTANQPIIDQLGTWLSELRVCAGESCRTH
jgi:arylsulfatase A-like enzyme